MTEQELERERAHLWRMDGSPIRTLEDACGFLESVGFCLVYPERSLIAPVFLGAYAGAAEGLPDAKHAFSDARTRPALELMVRLLRERNAYEATLPGDIGLLIAAPFFPFFYALLGDRNPKALPRTKAQGARISPLGLKVFDTIQKHGPLCTGKLQEMISRELTTAALDRALNELWSILRITRVGYSEQEGASWDLLYRWSPEAVKQGARLSLPEALSTLVSKYVDTAIAAGQEEIEQFFSKLAPRSKIREAIHALLAARELRLLTVDARPLIQGMPAQEPELERRGVRRVHG